MSNYDRYTSDQQTKIDRMEANCNLWEAEESACEIRIEDLTCRLSIAKNRRDQADEKLIAFVRKCDEQLEGTR